MKRAHVHREYRKPAPFSPPEGVVVVDGFNGGREAFVAGSEPIDPCGSRSQVASWEESDTSKPADPNAEHRPVERAAASPPDGPANVQKEPPKKEKKGLFGRIRDIFR